MPTTASAPGGFDERVVWLRRGVWTVLLAGLLAFLVRGADNPPDPLLVPAADAPATTGDSPEPEAATEDGQGVAAPTIPLPPATVGSPPSTPTSTSIPPGDPLPLTTSPGAAATAPPTSETVPSTTTTLRRPLPGFRQTAFRITDAEGGVIDGTAMLAADPTSRRQGLMEQTDLRGYDGMIFRSSSPTAGTFTMRNTLIPLSIAFFDGGGRFVSATDMEPCPDAVADCPSYAAAGPWLHAIEVAQGDLARLGIGPGSVLSFPPS